MSGYVIVVRPDEPGYTAETYPVDGDGLLSVIALLEGEPPSVETMTVRVATRSLNVRRVPAGEVTGAVVLGTRLTVYLPTQWAELGGHRYEWGRVERPLAGWVALGDGLTETIDET